VLKTAALATSDIIREAQFALDVKTKILPIYEKMFNIEYPLPKLDTLVVNDLDDEYVSSFEATVTREFADDILTNLFP
jgi:hypothetical protein